ncbi:MAG TPA: hypothetical protein EYP72_00265, partial [Rhodospirillales bacterium]|nr:hypothetical protein [Rhodospirillales bacterium]
MDIALEILSWGLLFVGSAFLVIGGIGVVRLPDVFTRMHGAGIIDTMGVGGVMSGLMIQAGFTIVSNAPGTVKLEIAGYTPSDGTLIVSTENEWYNNDDFTTYEPSGSSWLIQTRDLTGATPADAASTQFAFLFIPFANPPSEPGIEYTAFWDSSSGDWLTEANWKDTEAMHRWGIPGWVVGNPKNTGGSWENLSEAIIESGTANVTPASKPDGVVADLDMGYNGGTATLNISADFSVGDADSYVSIGVGAGSTGIVNMAAGVFESGCKRV